MTNNEQKRSDEFYDRIAQRAKNLHPDADLKKEMREFVWDMSTKARAYERESLDAAWGRFCKDHPLLGS